jgi:hypothetical protein
MTALMKASSSLPETRNKPFGRTFRYLVGANQVSVLQVTRAGTALNIEHCSDSAFGSKETTFTLSCIQVIPTSVEVYS